MIDFMKADLPDPFGVVVSGGDLMKISHLGEVEWTSKAKRNLQGSWLSSMHVRNMLADETEALGAQLHRTRRVGFEMDGNPAKFLQGHNLFGTSDAVQLATDTMERIAKLLDLPFDPASYDPSPGRLSVIDLTYSFTVERDTDVVPFLKSMQENVFCPYRGRGVFASADPGTVYYGYAATGKRAPDWQLKVYSKGREIGKRPLPAPAYEIPELLDEVNRTIRVELRLRTAELKRLGLRTVGDWNEKTAREVWNLYWHKLEWTEATMAQAMEYAGAMKPRQLDALASWEAGNDLRLGRSRTAFYKLRKEIKDLAGVDIANPPARSNVVPLRRSVVLQPALLPTWADRLTEALRAA